MDPGVEVGGVAEELSAAGADGEVDAIVRGGEGEGGLGVVDAGGHDGGAEDAAAAEDGGGEDAGKGEDEGEDVEIHGGHRGPWWIIWGDGLPEAEMSPAMSQHSNPQPYAITTTATGVLSRSSSTHSASAVHHFVPASPSRHRPNSHSVGAHELPRPLPAPPTPYRARRADTLPSASQRDLFGGHRVADLPADPRTWSPSDLSTYLSSASADLPPLAALVRTHGISGKKFLRLADGDLDR
jgi:hypothetical protein